MSTEKEQQITEYSESDIAEAVKGVAADIGKHYGDLSQLVLVGVMDGAVCFLADLMRELRTHQTGEKVRVTTVRMESFTGKGPRVIRCDWLPSACIIKGQEILIVDCMVGTGATCAFLKHQLQALQPHSVKVCALLDNCLRQERHEFDLEVDFGWFMAPHPYWKGYGSDYKGKFRNLPKIRSLLVP